MNATVTAWLTSILLILVTITIHVAGIGSVAVALRNGWRHDAPLRRRAVAAVAGAAFTAIAAAAVLALLHIIESLIWAVAFLWLGVFSAPADAVLYSLGSMSTRGSSGVEPAMAWHLMGALESCDGMLLFGISTAFLFALLRAFWNQAFADHTI